MAASNWGQKAYSSSIVQKVAFISITVVVNETHWWSKSMVESSKNPFSIIIIIIVLIFNISIFSSTKLADEKGKLAWKGTTGDIKVNMNAGVQASQIEIWVMHHSIKN